MFYNRTSVLDHYNVDNNCNNQVCVGP